MINSEFAEASAELVEILKYLPKEDVDRIPLKLRNFFKKAAKPNYTVAIDPYKSLKEQAIKEKTKDIIAVIYRNYWCDDEEKKAIDEKLIKNDQKYEEELREKYNPNNIFKSKATKEECNTEQCNNLIKMKHESLIQILFRRIKKIINKIKKFKH